MSPCSANTAKLVVILITQARNANRRRLHATRNPVYPTNPLPTINPLPFFDTPRGYPPARHP